jgi:hypothetical protein
LAPFLSKGLEETLPLSLPLPLPVAHAVMLEVTFSAIILISLRLFFAQPHFFFLTIKPLVANFELTALSVFMV